jgi:hypothetical protein
MEIGIHLCHTLDALPSILKESPSHATQKEGNLIPSSSFQSKLMSY